MKSLFLPFLAILFICNFSSSLHDPFTTCNEKSGYKYSTEPGLVLPGNKEHVSMASVTFKSHEFCRVEIENAEAGKEYELVSATVIFSGANFETPKQGRLSSSSLQPVKDLMEKCGPGSVITFDDIKVKEQGKWARAMGRVVFTLF